MSLPWILAVLLAYSLILRSSGESALLRGSTAFAGACVASAEEGGVVAWLARRSSSVFTCGDAHVPSTMP